MGNTRVPFHHFRTNMADPSDITARQVNTEAAAMSTADGTVVAFDAASVYKGMSTASLPFFKNLPIFPQYQ